MPTRPAVPMRSLLACTRFRPKNTAPGCGHIRVHQEQHRGDAARAADRSGSPLSPPVVPAAMIEIVTIVVTMVEMVVPVMDVITIAMYPASRHPYCSCIITRRPVEIRTGAGRSVRAVIHRRRDLNGDSNLCLGLCLSRDSCRCHNASECECAKNAGHLSSLRAWHRTSIDC
jgi:hypothetical protein